MSVAPGWMKLVSCVLFAAALRHADAQSLVIYDDTLENGFLDYSYTHDAGSIDFAATAQVHSGTKSIAFASAGFDAVKLASPTVRDTGTYPQFSFWFFGSAAQCNALQVVLEKNAGATDNEVARGDLSAYTTCSAGTGAWKQIVVDVTAAPMSFSGQFDRISLFDNSGGFGTAYFDDVSLQSAVVDPIFANGFEGSVVVQPPPNGLVEDHDVTVLSMVSDRFTWRDAANQPRVAVLAHNNGGAGPGGTQGGELRQFQYQVAAGTRTVNASSSPASGFGYVVSHPNEGDEACLGVGDSSSLGHFTSGTWTRIFEGRHHAIFRFQQNYPRYCSTVGAAEHDIPVTIDWTFSTGRDNPLWSISYDLSGVGVNVLEDDSRAPYGELLFDGSASEGAHSEIAGVGWGDRFKFKTTTSPVSLQSQWTWNTANTIPYVKLWTTAIDATMGTVQTQPITLQDAGGYFGSDRWNTTSTSNACNAGDEYPGSPAHPMPCTFNWDYQSINYSLDPGNPSSTTNNTRLAWGTEFGFLGQSAYHINGSTFWGGPVADATASGYPKKSYSLYVVLGLHSTDAVATQVTQAEAAQSTTVSATIGSVVTSGPAGVNRSDTITYTPAGYDAVYGALAFNAAANQLDANISTTVTLSKPLIIIRNYTAGAYPTTVKFGGTTLTMDTDYFPSLRTDKNELWITLNRDVTGANNRIQIAP
jgi:hypothetical protein